MANVNPHKEEIIERIKELIREGKPQSWIMDKLRLICITGLIIDI